MLAILALIILFWRLLIDGQLPEWSIWLLMAVTVLGALGGAFRSVGHVLRVGGGLTSAIIFYFVLSQTRPDLVDNFLSLGRQLLVVYILVWGPARIVAGFSRIGNSR